MFENIIVVAQQNAAPPAEGQSGDVAPGWTGMLPIFVIFGVMIFFMFRSQKKQAQKRKDMISSVKAGDDVVTNGGIKGVIEKVKEDYFVLKIADNVKIEVIHSAVGKVVGKEDNE
jgi:preprotein translocase subunit YajC